MKIYTMTFKKWHGDWGWERFEATCDTDARFTARMVCRKQAHEMACGFTLMDFYGNIIEL